MRILALAGSFALSGCCLLPEWGAKVTYDQSVATAVLDVPVEEAFTPPEPPTVKPAPQVRVVTPTDTIVELSAYADKAYAAFNLAQPWPQLRIVNKRHEMLHDRLTIAQAVVFTDLNRALYVNRDMLKRGRRIVESTIRHEAAHFSAWETHGHDIPEHGREFNETCLATASVTDCGAYR